MNPTEAARIARGFDRLAPIYELLAALASFDRIHRSQIALLPRLPPVERALILGGGGGRFLAELLASGRVEHVVSIDLSAAMTRRASLRVARGGRAEHVEFRVGGLERLGTGERYDLVVTHCFLDLFDDAELAPVVDRLAAALEPGGYWMFSDFSTGGAGLPGLLRRALVAALYCFFRATCGIQARRLPDFETAFGRHGFEELERHSLAGGLLRASLRIKRPSDGHQGRA